ncbi:Probable adenosine monophosphate-protein transferase fic [Fusobacterium necrophorum subsp. necrophorum]|nr:Probable adenosine monophosphate-protein transferase fic [Fusobacterium necrophorum subsp. necrophorum]
MIFKNKLGITDSLELARKEEKISKKKAFDLFHTVLLNETEIGTFKGLAKIHKYLFEDIYDFAGKIRRVNIAKGNFRFVPVLYLEASLEQIDKMPNIFDEIIEKYVEMNIAHPFERKWTQYKNLAGFALKKRVETGIDWRKVNKLDYLLAMERSPIKDTEIKILLHGA